MYEKILPEIYLSLQVVRVLSSSLFTRWESSHSPRSNPRRRAALPLLHRRLQPQRTGQYTVSQGAIFLPCVQSLNICLENDFMNWFKACLRRNLLGGGSEECNKKPYSDCRTGTWRGRWWTSGPTLPSTGRLFLFCHGHIQSIDINPCSSFSLL